MPTPVFTDYAAAEAFLGSLINHECRPPDARQYNTKIFDLERFRTLLAGLGDPHIGPATIHIAGTKGKGSTSAMLAAVLTSAGLRTGLYTSPHIERYTERITVNAREIPEADFCRVLARLAAMRGDGHLPASPPAGAGYRTVFEYLTAMAFVHFAETGAQATVIETGLGGRLDATNIFDRRGRGPLVNVITAIGFDHTAILGDTITQIAAEKAGILRPHARIVLGPQPPGWADEVRAVVHRRLADLGGCEALFDAGTSIDAKPVGAGQWIFTLAADAVVPSGRLAQALHQGLALRPALAGPHQVDNLRAMLGALVLLAPEVDVAPEAVVQGAAAVRWPGRFEIVCDSPTAIVDGAHCPLSAEALARTFRTECPGRQAAVVFAAMRDKHIDGIVAALARGLDIVAVHTCTLDQPRAACAADLARAWQRAGIDAVHPAGSMDEALAQAVQTARLHGKAVVLGCGSLFLVGPFRRWFQRQRTTATP
jgi:dihydrofolate synthase/folylpolyglutamate synthase